MISGTIKNDQLFGTAGNDQMLGMVGNDKLIGLAGDDVLNGGDGRDKLFGGPGADTFIVSKGRDIIKDFSSFEQDKIILADESFDLQMSRNGRNVRLISDSGVAVFKNVLMDDVQAAIVLDDAL